MWIGSGWGVGMGGIETMAAAIGADLAARLPRQNKKQREGLALLVATALDVRDVNLMELAAALPRAAERLDMRYQWISRLLANPLMDIDEVMAPRRVNTNFASSRNAGSPRVSLLIVGEFTRAVMCVPTCSWRLFPTPGRSASGRVSSDSTRRTSRTRPPHRNPIRAGGVGGQGVRLMCV